MLSSQKQTQGNVSLMNDFTIKLTETLLNNAPLGEFFRKELETALNSLLKTELCN